MFSYLERCDIVIHELQDVIRDRPSRICAIDVIAAHAHAHAVRETLPHSKRDLLIWPEHIQHVHAHALVRAFIFIFIFLIFFQPGDLSTSSTNKGMCSAYFYFTFIFILFSFMKQET